MLSGQERNHWSVVTLAIYVIDFMVYVSLDSPPMRGDEQGLFYCIFCDRTVAFLPVLLVHVIC